MAQCWVEGPQEACHLKWEPFHFCAPWLLSAPQVCQVHPYPRCRQDQSRGGRLPRALRRCNCDPKTDLEEAASQPAALPSHTPAPQENGEVYTPTAPLWDITFPVEPAWSASDPIVPPPFSHLHPCWHPFCQVKCWVPSPVLPPSTAAG